MNYLIISDYTEKCKDAALYKALGYNNIDDNDYPAILMNSSVIRYCEPMSENVQVMIIKDGYSKLEKVPEKIRKCIVDIVLKASEDDNIVFLCHYSGKLQKLKCAGNEGKWEKVKIIPYSHTKSDYRYVQLKDLFQKIKDKENEKEVKYDEDELWSIIGYDDELEAYIKEAHEKYDDQFISRLINVVNDMG